MKGPGSDAINFSASFALSDAERLRASSSVSAITDITLFPLIKIISLTDRAGFRPVVVYIQWLREELKALGEALLPLRDRLIPLREALCALRDQLIPLRDQPIVFRIKLLLLRLKLSVERRIFRTFLKPIVPVFSPFFS